METNACGNAKIEGDKPSPREGSAFARIDTKHTAVYGGCNYEKAECYDDLYHVEMQHDRLIFSQMHIDQNGI